jgi:flagellar basal-body rod modification protein FlgD
MITNTISAANQTVLSAATNSAATTSADGNERNMFMTLLVAQLKNQDPLQPQDGTAFVAQLAQFNSLDQLVGIRQSIEQLTAQLQQIDNTPPTDTSSDR